MEKDQSRIMRKWKLKDKKTGKVLGQGSSPAEESGKVTYRQRPLPKGDKQDKKYGKKKKLGTIGTTTFYKDGSTSDHFTRNQRQKDDFE